jgi:DeoR/GlpR family transcriptional regulator of sugar metabolism
VHTDLFLLGVTGGHHQAGLTTGDPDEAAMERTLVGRAADTCVLASSEKSEAAAAFVVLQLDEVSGIITDAPAGHPVLIQLQRAGVSTIRP